MVNNLLHLITNKTVFPGTEFPSNLGVYTPYNEPSDVLQIKSILKLDYTENDYYLKCVLSLIDNYDYLRNKFDNSKLTYNINSFLPESSEILYAEAIKDREGVLKFNYDNTPYPVKFIYKLTYKDREHAYLEGSTIRVFSVGNKIYPVWPDNFIYTGGFELIEPWGENTIVEIKYYPKSYPAVAIVKALENNFSKENILLNAGLLEPFIFSKDAYEKVAIMAAALGLVNPNYVK